MSQLTRRGFVGSLLGAAAATALNAQQAGSMMGSQKRPGGVAIKITDLRCAIIGRNPVIRITTDQGVSGYGQAESAKPYLKPMVLFYKPYLIGSDPTDVARIMLRIRRLGAFKPWGAAVSAIEIALWDIAGQVAGVPVYQLLGGKIRDRVMAYGNSENNTAVFSPRSPEQCAEIAGKMKEAKEGYKLVKMPVAFHNSAMMNATPNAWFGEHWTGRKRSVHGARASDRTWPRIHPHLRGSGEEGSRRRDRPGPRLRAWLGPKGCHPLRARGRALSPHLARRHDHRRRGAVSQTRRSSRS